MGASIGRPVAWLLASLGSSLCHLDQHSRLCGGSSLPCSRGLSVAKQTGAGASLCSQ